MKLAKANRDLTTGAILLAVPLMLLFVPMLFIGNLFPWLIIWSIVFGWMAIWGTAAVAGGIGGLIESKTLMRVSPQNRGDYFAPQETGLLPVASGNRVTSPDLIDSGSAPASVTEATTRNLDDGNGN